jgi:hypothetical protein
VKQKILNAVIFLCVPVAIFVTAIIHRERLYHGKAATMWFEEMQTNQDVALNAMKQMGDGAVPALTDELKSSSLTERCRAALALGKLGPVAASAIPDLIQTLDDKQPEVQCEAMLALSRLNITNQDLIPKLISKLTDKRTGNYAATLLNSIERERAVENLSPFSNDGCDYGSACLKSSIPSMRLNGAIQLAKIAQKDQRAKTALQSLLHDENGWVRQETAQLMTNPTALANFKLVSE